MLRRITPLAALVALVAFAPTARAATIWTPIASGTSGTISSIVYQGPTRLWYATSGGAIAFWNGAAFTAASGTTAGEDFVDLAFQPTSVPGGPGTAGLTGYAVTSNGHLWRSSDGGETWSKLTSPTTRSDCGSSSTPGEETELNAVQWANGTTVFLMGNDSTILRSANATAGSPTFTEINKVDSGTCAVQNEASQENITDATFLPANPTDALFVDQDFGGIYQSSDVLSGSASGARVNDDTVNSFQGNPHRPGCRQPQSDLGRGPRARWRRLRDPVLGAVNRRRQHQLLGQVRQRLQRHRRSLRHQLAGWGGGRGGQRR